MRRLVLSCLLLTGCPTPSPADVGADGGVDAPVLDGGSDAGPCGVCDTATPFCDTASMMCVECLMPTDCTGAGEAACVAGSCVACDTNDDCPAETPQCSATNTCEACTGNDGCMGRDEGGVCDSGTCVECTMDDRTACTSGVCLLSTNTCAPMGGSTALCGDCTADTDCAAGQVCAPTEFPVGSGTVIGSYCLWRLDASPGPMGACSRVPPYGREDMVMTASGADLSVCTPRVSTCEALLDFSATPCGMGGTAPTTPDNAACGVTGVDDGFCRVRDAASNRCTVACTTYDDCPCTEETCARQYDCQANRCDFARTCDTTTGTCG